MEFKSFNEIKALGKIRMTVTQKIHGSNAQVYIFEYTSTDGQSHEPRIGIKAGSRNRWIYPHDDNYGFAAYVEKNKEALIEKLGVGTHFGEWAGPGINSGEGLTEKTFLLFDVGRYKTKEDGTPDLPPQCGLVPLLYQGPLDLAKVDEIMADLKTNGSKLSPGFMRPEGIVVDFAGKRYKKVFEAEDTGWTKSAGNKGMNPKTFVDFSHLCQPIRLEKLLSRDEVYVREFPTSLPRIVKDYVADLIKEDQITGTEDEIKSITKGASGQIFKFIRTVMNERGL